MTSSPPSPPTVATGQPSLHKVTEQQLETSCSREDDRSLEVPSAAPASNEGGTPPLGNLGSLEDQSQALKTQRCQTEPQHGSSLVDLSTREASTHSDPENAPIHTKPADATKSEDGTFILEASTQAGDTADPSLTRTHRSELQPLAPAPLAPSPLMPLVEQGTAFVSRLLPIGSLENISMVCSFELEVPTIFLLPSPFRSSCLACFLPSCRSYLVIILQKLIQYRIPSRRHLLFPPRMLQRRV